MEEEEENEKREHWIGLWTLSSFLILVCQVEQADNYDPEQRRQKGRREYTR